MVLPETGQLRDIAWFFGILLSILGSFLFAWWVSRPEGRLGQTLSTRFIHGIPWGSFVTVFGVLGFYLFAQGGVWHWNSPVTVPFTATSYFYPLGMLTAAFAHSSASHLTNNLLSTLVLAPLAEYVWGHYPERNGANNRLLSNPYARAFLLFPAGVFAVGIMTALFAWGPVIGFSGVVFAFVGFSLVKFPLLTVVAITARTAVHIFTAALSNPVVVAEATTRFTRPSWAGTAVQGHALGLFIGVALGGILLWYRNDRTDPVRLWVGSLLAGMALSLWALWWTRGQNTYVLYRGAGIILVATFAVIITAAIVTSDRRIWGDLTARQAAILVLCIPLLTMMLVAVPLNINVLTADNPSDSGIEIGGEYVVFYDEDVQDRMYSVIDIEILNETTDVTTTGVIVVNEDRHIWRQAVSAAQLAHYGDRTVVVGGLGWRETVDVKRQGWEPVGNDTVYAVWLQHDGDRELSFESEPKSATPVIANHEFTFLPASGDFAIEVRWDSGTETTPIPAKNESVTVNDIEVENDDGDLIVTHENRTTVRIASIETYE